SSQSFLMVGRRSRTRSSGRYPRSSTIRTMMSGASAAATGWLVDGLADPPAAVTGVATFADSVAAEATGVADAADDSLAEGRGATGVVGAAAWDEQAARTTAATTPRSERTPGRTGGREWVRIEPYSASGTRNRLV